MVRGSEPALTSWQIRAAILAVERQHAGEQLDLLAS